MDVDPEQSTAEPTHRSRGDWARPSPPDDEDHRFLRFHQLVQKSRIIVYTVGFVIALAGRELGVLDFSLTTGLLFVLIADLSAFVCSRAYRAGMHRLVGLPLHVYWMTADIAIITWAVHISGGSNSNFYVWYLANAAAAAFVAGPPALLWVMAGNLVAYETLVLLVERPEPIVLTEVFGRMILLYGAAFFALLGIIRLQRKRREVTQLRRLERSRSLHLEELAKELRRRTVELDTANARLQDAIVTDPLTRLQNRRYVLQSIHQDVSAVERNAADEQAAADADGNSYLGFVMLDIDRFKRVNDRYGHEAGDRVLQEVASRFRRALRGSDTVVRWGGEEFLVIARHVSMAGLPGLADRIRLAVGRTRVTLPRGQEIQLTCSAGFAVYPFATLELFSWEEVVRLADHAMLTAKRAGRNCSRGLRPGSRPIDPSHRDTVLEDPDMAVREGFLEAVVLPATAQTAPAEAG